MAPWNGAHTFVEYYYVSQNTSEAFSALKKIVTRGYKAIENGGPLGVTGIIIYYFQR